jgi:hypothetical protein
LRDCGRLLTQSRGSIDLGLDRRPVSLPQSFDLGRRKVGMFLLKDSASGSQDADELGEALHFASRVLLPLLVES